MADLTNPIFTDEDAARRHFEATRWPDGPYCPLCGSFDKVKPFGGTSMGPGWYYCSSCRRKATFLAFRTFTGCTENLNRVDAVMESPKLAA